MVLRKVDPMTEPSDFLPYEPPKPSDPAERVPAEVPPRAALAGQLLGRAEGVQLRTESRGNGSRDITVLAFRRHPAGTTTPYEVELRGTSLTGTVRDGDWVEVPAPSAPGNLLAPTRIMNLTSRTTVETVGDPRTPASRALRFVVIGIFVVFLLVFIVFFVTTMNAPF